MADSFGVQFTIDESHEWHVPGLPSFTDTLWFLSVDQLPNKSEMDRLKKERYDNWCKVVTAPPPEPEPVSIEDAKSQAQSAIVQAREALDLAAAALDQVE